MKPSAQILIVLALVLMMQLVQSWQLAALPQALLSAQAQVIKAAQERFERQQLAEARASLAQDEGRRQQQQAAFEQKEFQAALARIPADVPEPQRSAAARELLRHDLEHPRPGETKEAFQSRLTIRRAMMIAEGL